ncbi:hypothetical protein FHR97_002230 [Halomonas stenophila]|uniref:Uncharacterized protein n=1 Tax=Halomonas stenophila TaxID=795312 RepID=A0A7W5EV49_9GAMM|nr:hypothetical protein [Halomonas stenophila]
MPTEGEDGQSVLILHESQLEPVLELLEERRAQNE